MSKPSAGAAKAAPREEGAGAVRALTANRLELVLASAGRIGNQFAATTPIGTPFEHVLRPEFWALTAYKLRPGDEIIVHTDDMSYRGHLYVRDVAGAMGQRLNNRAVVAQLAFDEFGALKREMRTKTHEVRFLGPHSQWSVVSLADDRIVKDQFGTSEQAADWMRAQAV